MKRFPEIELWIQYIEYSKSLDSPKLTGKLFGEYRPPSPIRSPLFSSVPSSQADGSALQKFPSSAELWIMAAQYEFNKNANMTGARNLLLRSLRLNPETRELWLEYARLECLFLFKIMERRRVLGLDKEETTSMEEDALEFDKRDEIQLPAITAEDLEKQDRGEGSKLDPVLATSPLADVARNPALNGAIPLAVYDSAVGTRPEDISLATGFYDVFVPFYSGLQFIDAALDKVRAHLEEKFPGRGRTVLVQIKDHARGIDVADKTFPGTLREMMKTANTVPSLPLKERKDCCAGLQKYLDDLLGTPDLDEDLYKAIEIFRGKVAKWQDIKDM